MLFITLKILILISHYCVTLIKEKKGRGSETGQWGVVEEGKAKENMYYM